MKKLLPFALLAAFGFTCLPTLAKPEGPEPAQRGEQGPRGERGERGERGKAQRGRGHMIARALLRGLDLNEAQKEVAKAALQEAGEKLRAWHEENKEAFQAFGEHMRTWHKENKEAISALKKEVNEARESGDRDTFLDASGRLFDLLQSRPKPDSELQSIIDARPKAEAELDRIREVLDEDQRTLFDANVLRVQQRMAQMHNGTSQKGNRGSQGKDGRRGKSKDARKQGPHEPKRPAAE